MKTRKPQRLLLILIHVAIVGIGLQQPASAQEGTYEVQIKKKSEAKKSNRWTLADWLTWKEQQKAMDMWLAKNSHHSPFEFSLESSALNYDRMSGYANSPKSNSHHYGGTLAAYAGVAGLRAAYISSVENYTTWNGSFNLRLFRVYR